MVERKLLTHVTVGTHVSGNCLDLVLSSAFNMVLEVKSEGRLGSSDHEMLLCSVNLGVECRGDGGREGIGEKQTWKRCEKN